ncbi:MAG: SLBB domain-containing protein [Tannerellaceae bacterium]|nr:SLBB domain-containing protein [Tannerellaceae bacterium]
MMLPAGAQVSKDLIEKAKAMGISQSQINSVTAGNETIPHVVPVASQVTVTDRSVLADAAMDSSFMETPVDVSKIVFGREIFRNKRLSFETDLNIPTPKDYRLSAGDELLINVWGDSELNLKLRVSPEGTVLIPNLGPVSMSGRTVSEAETHLKRELGRIMISLGSAGSEAKTFVSVSLSQIRSIKVNMVGELVSPGTYTLPSFATLFNAIYAAGGVNNIGTLREIKLFRNSKQVVTLDVYDYLLHGKYESNVRLEENDMVIVGTYDQLVTINGQVKRNRIYELEKGETLEDLLEMAGGFTGEAYVKDVQVKRKSETRYQIATVSEGKFADFMMRDGDEVVVGAVVPFYENRLTVTGAVWRPGEYELTEEVHTIKQLVEQAAGLKGDEFLGRAQVTRLNADFTTTMIAVDVQGILAGIASDFELQAEDILHIPSQFDLREAYTVTVLGFVNMPNTTIPYSESMTIEDAIIQAGGLRESASAVNVEVARRLKDPYAKQSSRRTAETFSFTLDQMLRVNGMPFVLEPFDEIFVRRSPGYQEQHNVQLGGEVTFAGNYSLEEKNTRISTVIAKAGGVTEDAYVRGASLLRKLSAEELLRIETVMEMARRTPNDPESAVKQMIDMDTTILSTKEYSVGIDLEKALARPGSEYDVVLRDGDKIYIPRTQSTVRISGEVVFPNVVTYTKGMSLRDGLLQAGGYSSYARKYPLVVYMNGNVGTTHRTCLFFKKYPHLEPGCEIIVPRKPMRREMTSSDWWTVGQSASSMVAMMTTIANLISRW